VGSANARGNLSFSVAFPRLADPSRVATSNFEQQGMGLHTLRTAGDYKLSVQGLALMLYKSSLRYVDVLIAA